MPANPNRTAANKEPVANGEKAQIPAISLPKGGGAIRGMGEKFAANPVTGTGSMTVPIATSSGRSGFGPQLSLSYDSGAGNGPFGFGWNLSLPAITRKTDKGLPKYQDADVFILSGAEDLVPVLTRNASGEWTPEVVLPRIVNGVTYRIQRYRPRIEGLFARIERWTNQADPKDTFWRSISKDNITTWYGKTEKSRITDPSDPTRIFSWLICESYDDKGNVIAYEYKEENSDGVDVSQAHERNRSAETRKSNRYLKRIRYGNHKPYLPSLSRTDTWPSLPEDGEWFFEVVFDYGEHDATAPMPNDTGAWNCRNDPLSSYRAGFEVRTYRLCQRVLMFHHFPGEQEGLIRSTDFTYSYEQNPLDARNPIFSFLLSVTQFGYKRQGDTYLKKSLPPLAFEYTQPDIDETVREVDPESLENLPYGLDGTNYQWVDLDGEGLSGILTEQAEGWFYKRNLSPINVVKQNGKERIEARFAPVESVAQKPSLAAISSGRQQLLDLAGDGQLDLVELRGPMPGFYERTEDGQWESFVPFAALPVLDWSNPNLKFVDLTGDGHADILVTEDDIFTWHPSLAEDGFGPAERVHQAWDEEEGPRLVFADGTQSIYLADMSGDGLTDLVRIRNGEVCYWPNLGYGRFGAKVTMDNAPWFDNPDLFEQRRIRPADIDGSGVTDIIYLGSDGVRLYFNQSGNGWSGAKKLNVFPRMDSLTSVQALDLLGNGTACLVWSSPLPSDMRRPMRYIDLMGGQKPHLLVKTVNNLGAETHVQYAPSTKFYVADKLAGKPWVTKLSFPVHVVEKVTVKDKWRKTEFSSTYSYHHGYYDGVEREFRGFGRVEQIDVESFDKFASGNAASPYITDDQTLYQPPVKTVTWFHTGAFLDRQRILSHFKDEYFPNWFEALNPAETNVLGDFQENNLPEPDVDVQDLSPDEWREALRACKGMMLRQEVYELDVDALHTRHEYRPVELFSTAYHNCHIRRVQPKSTNQHAVFLVTESEAITYHYELDLRPVTLRPDPRIAHTLNLKIDEYGNVLQSVAVVYPRLGRHVDNTLPAGAEDLIARVQRELHLTYTETRYTQDVNEPDNHRLRLLCETLTYELTGVGPEDADDKTTPDPRDNRYFTIDELRGFHLSDIHQTAGREVENIAYHDLPNRTTPQKRLVEHARMLYFNENLRDPLELGVLNWLGLPYETYKLALTDDLLNSVFGAKLTTEVLNTLKDRKVSGYLKDATGQYWIRSGIAGFQADAAQHFYLPERYTDPFDNTTTLKYKYDLYIESSSDPLGNTVTVDQFDFRVLAPRVIKDINDNLSEVVFDALGMASAMALKGKGNEGDNLNGFDDALINPDLDSVIHFFTGNYDKDEARRLLGNATARHVYYFGETRNPDGSVTWGTHPSCACAILRERHLSQLAPGEQSPLQTAFEYSDGLGSVLVKKVQAEPEAAGQPLRWVASGKTILNNKGKPVKQYEPYFSAPEVAHRFEEPREEGVTPVIYYDAIGRTVRTELPDGSYSRIEFSPWHVTTYDPNDTVTEPGNAWFAHNTAATAAATDRRAAQLTADHTSTPALTILDSLGREVVSIAHNRVRDGAGGLKDEKYPTFTKLDAEGKPLWIRDARNNLVMQYITPSVPNDQPTDPIAGFVPCYDIAGNLMFQHSMDAGERWMLNDVAGKPIRAWDSRGHMIETRYDELRRPVEMYVSGGDDIPAGARALAEKTIYGESKGPVKNHRGKVYQHDDGAGVVTNVEYDFKGNLKVTSRKLVNEYKKQIDWNQPPADDETFTSRTTYDALNRPTQLIEPHRDQVGSTVNVIEPIYNEANLLEQVHAWLNQDIEPTDWLDPITANLHAVSNIDYNAKGQRTLIQYGNGAITDYTYDPDTFRLIHLKTTRQNVPPSEQVVQDLSYTYDPVGNITHIRDDAQQTIFFRNQRVEPSADYIYDAIYRLIKATGREHLGQAGGAPVPTSPTDMPRVGLDHPNNGNAMGQYDEEYLYDEVGNILSVRHRGTDPSQPGWKRCYQYALDSNRLLSTGSPSDPNNPDSACPVHYATTPTYAERYEYDVHGNMTKMPHLQQMAWDFKDELQSVDMGGGGKAFYMYDAGGQRVRKVWEKSASLIEERIYLSGFEIYRKRNGSGNVTLERETLHIMDDKQRIALIETRTQGNDGSPAKLIRYQFSNHLGSASLELNDQAKIISYEEYYPYGSTSYQAVDKAIKAAAKRYRYTGKERDEESGLYYHGARYYAPWLCLWISTDPKPRLNASWFHYAANNPIKFHDPEGTEERPTLGTSMPNLGDLGFRRQDVVWRYSARVIEDRHVVGEGWQYLTPTDRQAFYLHHANAEIRREGMPPVERSAETTKMTAEFDSKHWSVIFRRDFSEDDKPTMSEVAMNAAAVAHELRHAEQYFLMARFLAGRGMSAPQIAHRMGIPGRVARAAHADPLPNEGLAAAAASLFYQSRYGEGKKHRRDVLQKVKDAGQSESTIYRTMTTRERSANRLLTKALTDTKVTARQAERLLNKALAMYDQVYQKDYPRLIKANTRISDVTPSYRALPMEADAFELYFDVQFHILDEVRRYQLHQ